MDSDQTGTTPLDGISAADLARILAKLERYLDAELAERDAWRPRFVPSTSGHAQADQSSNAPYRP